MQKNEYRRDGILGIKRFQKNGKLRRATNSKIIRKMSLTVSGTKEQDKRPHFDLGLGPPSESSDSSSSSGSDGSSSSSSTDSDSD